MVRAAIIGKSLEKLLWAGAAAAMAHVKNRLHHSSVPYMTLFETFYDKKKLRI
jgi:hypothetical protein